MLLYTARYRLKVLTEFAYMYHSDGRSGVQQLTQLLFLQTLAETDRTRQTAVKRSFKRLRTCTNGIRTVHPHLYQCVSGAECHRSQPHTRLLYEHHTSSLSGQHLYRPVQGEQGTALSRVHNEFLLYSYFTAYTHMHVRHSTLLLALCVQCNSIAALHYCKPHNHTFPGKMAVLFL